MPPDPFKNCVGHFWGLSATRAYMRACYAHIEQLSQIKTHDSVTTQLHFVMECLRLSRSDNMGVCAIAPHLMLRLDMDQKSYDFVKWWQTGNYDHANSEPRHLEVEEADCFESVNYLCDKWIDLSQTVAVILLKIKVVLDLISLQESMDSKKIPANVPTEIFNDIRDRSVRSPLVKANEEIMESIDQTDRIHKLVRQVKALHKAVDNANKYVWPTLLYPGTELSARPKYYHHGKMSEVQHVLKFTYDA